MAIASASQYNANIGIQEIFGPNFVDAVYRNNELLSLFPERESMGGDQYLWKVNSAGQTAEVFAEGAAASVPDSQTVVNMNLSYIYFRVNTRITGHLRDALQRQGAFPQFHAIQDQFTKGAMDVRDLMNTTFLGTANNGLQVAVDSTTTYAGQARGSATFWESYELAVGGVHTHAMLMTMRRTLRDNNRGGRMNMLLMPHNQVENYQNLPGAPGAANNSRRSDLTASGGAENQAPTLTGSTFGEAIVVGVGDLTDEVVLGLDTTDIFYVKQREFSVRQQPTGDDDLYQLSAAGTIVVENPLIQGKLTGVTA